MSSRATYTHLLSAMIVALCVGWLVMVALRWVFLDQVIITPVIDLYENAARDLGRIASLYVFSVPAREKLAYALPDVEVFHVHEPEDVERTAWDDPDSVEPVFTAPGWYYAFGFPGCLWDSVPCGPFDSETNAVADARDDDPVSVEIGYYHTETFQVRM